MGYDSTGIEGIVVCARNLAWIENKRIKVIEVVKGWDGRTVDLAKISKRFHTPTGPAIEYKEILAAFAFYAQEQNRAICDQQIQTGEDTPVFTFWTEEQTISYNAFMTPFLGGYSLLEGSLIAPSMAPSASEYSGVRSKWIEEGCLVDDQLVKDIWFRKKSLRKLTSIVSGSPNSGNDSRSVRVAGRRCWGSSIL